MAAGRGDVQQGCTYRHQFLYSQLDRAAERNVFKNLRETIALKKQNSDDKKPLTFSCLPVLTCWLDLAYCLRKCIFASAVFSEDTILEWAQPSRAVAARLALCSARHTSAQVLADPRASPLTVPALLRREVLHGVRALCCRGEWAQGWCQCWCCNPMSHMALTSAGPGVAVAGLEVGSHALGTTKSRGGAGSAAGLNAGIAGSRALRPG